MKMYPLVMTNSLLLKMAIEIVDLPIDSMVIFHSFCKRLPEGKSFECGILVLLIGGFKHSYGKWPIYKSWLKHYKSWDGNPIWLVVSNMFFSSYMG